jgi:hypothetical protein
MESNNYEILTLDELFSKLKSSELDRGVRGKIENPTNPHSLTLVSRSRSNANLLTRQFSLSALVSMLDEEFDVLGEEDLALLSKRFKHMYVNHKNARRSSGMCHKCVKHMHFIVECPGAMENMVMHKHSPRTEHKHRSRNDCKNKNKSEQRPRKSGGHKKKTEHVMVVGASNIDSSSYYTSSSSSGEEEDDDRRKDKRSTKNFNGLCFRARLLRHGTHLRK